MGARVTVTVVLPGTNPIAGIPVRALNRNAWNKDHAVWLGTTDAQGKWTWPNLDTGAAGDLYDFSARYVDPDGVLWLGAVTDRIRAPREITISLHPAFVDEIAGPTLSKLTLDRLQSTPEGGTLLEGFTELQSLMSLGATRAVITTSSYILEGLIRVHAKTVGIDWKGEWDRLTFGQLIEIPEIRKLFPVGLIDRADALARLRRPAAHFKGQALTAAEAQISVSVAVDTAEAWFGTPTLVRTGTVGPTTSTGT